MAASKDKDKTVEKGPTETLIEGDKITYSGGRKVTDGNYGSYDFHCSYGTNLRPGESPGDAINRAMNIVERVLEHKVESAGKNRLKY